MLIEKVKGSIPLLSTISVYLFWLPSLSRINVDECGKFQLLCAAQNKSRFLLRYFSRATADRVESSLLSLDNFAVLLIFNRRSISRHQRRYTRRVI